MTKHLHILANEKIGKSLFKLSAPAMIGMFVMALYNLVDTIFIGQGVGIIGIAAVSIFFPIQMLMMALAQTIGIGEASMISRLIGSNKKLEAQNVLGNVFLLILGTSIIFMIGGLIFIKPFNVANNIVNYNNII